MESRGSAFVFLFVSVFFAFDVYGQVATLCRPNERFLSCGGCQKTCADPSPVCAAVCRQGCYCNDNEVRNSTGHCIKIADCPSVSLANLHTSEPRSINSSCPENEEYKFCETCSRTCENLNPICPAQCARGCFCKEKLVRNRDGRCVREEECGLKRKENSNYIKPIPYQPSCGPHQLYKDCQKCELTCSSPNPVCATTCVAGCFCEEGYLKAPSGNCVKLQDCPKANYIKPIPYQPSCGPHQLYKDCQKCELTCSSPNPVCATTCAAGCFCEEGYLKASSGNCVKLQDCPKANYIKPVPYQPSCGPHQLYKDCQKCELTCGSPNPVCATTCAAGCFCEEGYLKAPSGNCVKLQDCPKANYIKPVPYQPSCGPHQLYKDCQKCELTCSSPNPVCATTCAAGCFCEEGYLKAPSGNCVKLQDCPKANYIKPIPYQPSCGPHQLYKDCQKCELTCSSPNPVCATTCAAGCFCEEGYLKAPSGNCVKLQDCPEANYIKPIPYQPSCGPHQLYKDCQKCELTCGSPNPVCATTCAAGCFCEEGYLKAPSGNCVKLQDCPKANYIKPIPYQLSCGPHQLYKDCQKCELTCSSPNPVCATTCAAGCFCEEGYLKAPSGNCVKLQDCPKAEVTMGAHEPSVEDCSNEEVYLTCGWCEPSCWDPRPECPPGVCTRGCLCRPPLLRHHSGRCVEDRHCAPQKCSDPGEEFVCRYGCEARCDNRKCPSRPQRCVLGCHCKLGLLRDADFKCVTPEKCSPRFHVIKNTPPPTTPLPTPVNILNNSFTQKPNIFKFDDMDSYMQMFGEQLLPNMKGLPISQPQTKIIDIDLGSKTFFDTVGFIPKLLHDLALGIASSVQDLDGRIQIDAVPSEMKRGDNAVNVSPHKVRHAVADVLQIQDKDESVESTASKPVEVEVNANPSGILNLPLSSSEEADQFEESKPPVIDITDIVRKSLKNTALATGHDKPTQMNDVL